jgi:hypothetical protein
MSYHYWRIEGPYAVHIATGYECYLLANLGPGYTWADHIADTKPWANPTCLAELRAILAARVKVAALAHK